MSKKVRRILSLIFAFSMIACIFAGCTTTPVNEESSSGAEAVTGKVYTIGICQLVQHNAIDDSAKGFTDALREKLGNNVEFDIQNAAGDSSTCSTIINQFVSSKVDLIMTNTTSALQTAISATADIPIVATSITDFATALEADEWNGCTGINVTGASDLMPIPTQAAMFSELLPEAESVGIVYCSSEPNSKYQVEMISAEFDKLSIAYNVYTVADTNEVAAVVTQACSENDALYIPTDNTLVSATATIDEIAAFSKTPVITADEGSAAVCAVATLSVNYYDIGYKAGEMAYDILVNGKDPAEMQIEYSANPTKKYIAANCQKFGITVPADYEELIVEAK